MTFREALKQFELVYELLQENNLLRPSYMATMAAIKATIATHAVAEKTVSKKNQTNTTGRQEQ